MMGQAIRAINVSFIPGTAQPGAMTGAGDNETSSRPPKDLGGTLRYAPALQAAVSRSYDSLANGGLQYPLAGGAWQIRRSE